MSLPEGRPRDDHKPYPKRGSGHAARRRPRAACAPVSHLLDAPGRAFLACQRTCGKQQHGEIGRERCSTPGWWRWRRRAGSPRHRCPATRWFWYGRAQSAPLRNKALAAARDANDRAHPMLAGEQPADRCSRERARPGAGSNREQRAVCYSPPDSVCPENAAPAR